MKLPIPEVDQTLLNKPRIRQCAQVRSNCSRSITEGFKSVKKNRYVGWGGYKVLYRCGIQGSGHTGPLPVCAYPFLFVSSLLTNIAFPSEATELALYF